MKLQCIQNDLTWLKTEISRQHEHVLSCATHRAINCVYILDVHHYICK